MRQRVYQARPRRKPDQNTEAEETEGPAEQGESGEDAWQAEERRKKEKKKKRIRVSLDLTGRRYSLLKQAREKLQGTNGYAYANMNCHLTLCDGREGRFPFNSESELNILINDI